MKENIYEDFSDMGTSESNGVFCLDLLLFLWDDYEGDKRWAKMTEIIASKDCPFKNECPKYKRALKKNTQPPLGFKVPTTKKTKVKTKSIPKPTSPTINNQMKLF